MKKYIILVVLLLLAVAVFGCAEDGATPDDEATSLQPDESGEGSVANEDQNISADDVTLRFSWWGGDARHEATISAIDMYMYRNPHVTIEAEFSGFDGYVERVSTQLAGGTEPDIMQLDHPWLPDFWPQSNFFVDFNDYLHLIDIAGFDQDFLNDFGYFEDRLVALPTGLNALSFLVNQRVLDAAGVNFSDTITWEELISEGRKINEHDPNNFMINMDIGTVFFVTRMYLYQLTGNPLVNEDFTIGFTRDQLLEAWEFTLRLYEENVIIPLEESLLFQGSPHDNPGWNNDRFGGWFNWASTAILQDWGEHAVALPYPILDNARQSSYIVRPAQVVCVSLNSDSIEAAVQFLNFFFNDEEAAIVLTDTRAIPPVARNRDLLGEMGLINQIVVDSVNLAIANVGRAENALSMAAEVGAAFDVVFERLVFGMITPEQAVEETFSLLELAVEDLEAAGR